MKVEPYQYYQRNTCLDGISIKMSKYFKNILIENNIIFKDSLWVYADIPALNRVAHEYFSLIVNYPKGKGNRFKLYREKNHPSTPLVYIINCKGSQ